MPTAPSARGRWPLRLPHPWRGAPCLLCGAGRTEAGLCNGCRGDLARWPQTACRGCARRLAASDAPCPACAVAPPTHGPVTAGGPYVWPLDAVIRAFKFRGVMSLAPPLATLVAEAVGSPPPRALLVPVPLAPARARARGFNPAAELARSLAGALDLRWDPDLLVRVRDTRAQSSLPRAGRAANVQGAFAARRHPGPGPVVLVDDVLTTGATAAAAARALIEAGAIDLRTWVVARARPHGAHRTDAPPAPTGER